MILFYFERTELTHSQAEARKVIELAIANKLECRVLLPSAEGEMVDWLKAKGIAYDVLAMPQLRVRDFKGFWSLLSYFRKSWRYFKMYPFELVYADGVFTGFLSIALKVRYSVPLFWQVRESLAHAIPKNSWKVPFLFLAHLFADRIFAASMRIAHEFGRSVNWREKMIVLYSGEAVTVAPKMRVVGGAPQFTCYAPGKSLNSYKLFLRAIELVHRAGKESAFRFIGPFSMDEAFCSELEALATELKVSDLVTFSSPEEEGTDKDVLQYLKKEERFTVFVNGGMGEDDIDSTLTTAMGSQIPIIAFRTGLPQEILIHETTGLLATAGDANALSKEIIKLIENPALASELSKNAFEEHAVRFNRNFYERTLLTAFGVFLESEIESVPAADTGADRGKKQNPAA